MDELMECTRMKIALNVKPTKSNSEEDNQSRYNCKGYEQYARVKVRITPITYGTEDNWATMIDAFCRILCIATVL